MSAKKEEGNGANPTTVVFDVGGHIHKFNRSIFTHKYADSMLSRMMAPEWKSANPTRGTDGNPIFLDRDGVRFGFLLDFVRDGRVELPVGVSRAQFLVDLEYYGIELNEQEKKSVTSQCSVANAREFTVNLTRKRERRLAEIDETLERLPKERSAIGIAKTIFDDWCKQQKNVNSTTDQVEVRIGVGDVELVQNASQASKFLKEELRQYGVDLISSKALSSTHPYFEAVFLVRALED